MRENKFPVDLDTLTELYEAALEAVTTLGRAIEVARANPVRPTPRTHLTVDEAAAAMGISRSTLYRRVLDGTIRSVKVGGRRLILAETLSEVA